MYLRRSVAGRVTPGLDPGASHDVLVERADSIAFAIVLSRHPMKFGELKSVGHNIADSLASGIGLLIGVYRMDIFGEAVRTPDGFIDVDFMTGTTGAQVSPELARAIGLYREALRRLCDRHGVEAAAFRTLSARYGVDARYGGHFTVTIEDRNGRRSVDRYLGVPGRRIRTRR
jgi:hypothetical protein